MSSSTATAIRLVCLDLGGVLIRICRNWGEACQAAQLRLPPDFLERAGPHVLAGLADLSRRHEGGRIDEAAFVRGTSELTGLAPQQIVAAMEGWLREPYPGAADLVARLAAHPSTQSACLTNTTPRHWRILTAPGPLNVGLDRLTWPFRSYEIGHMKPSAEIFRHVERVTGLTPGEILFFDDNPDNVAGARACGWRAEVIDPATDPPGQVNQMLARYGLNV